MSYLLWKLRFYVQKEQYINQIIDTKMMKSLRRYSERIDCTQERDVNASSDIPEEPTTCCMSGCANCVWIQYAEKLTKVLQDGKKSQEIVLEKVTDPNMRAFLMTELRALEKIRDNT